MESTAIDRLSACPTLLQRVLRQPPLVRGVVDELRQPPRARLLLLRARHPADGKAAVAGRLGGEELPRLLVRAERLLVLGREFRRRLFVRVDRRLFLVARLEGAQAGG